MEADLGQQFLGQLSGEDRRRRGACFCRSYTASLLCSDRISERLQIAKRSYGHGSITAMVPIMAMKASADAEPDLPKPSLVHLGENRGQRSERLRLGQHFAELE